MQLNRRQFCQLLGASMLSPALPARAGDSSKPLFASASWQNDQAYLLMLDNTGHERFRHPLPGRGHHVELHPHQPWLAAPARRPGTWLDLVDYRNGKLLKRIQAEAGQHFYGHCVFSADGSRLFSTEQDIASGEGRISVRDMQADGFPVIANWYSGGIGPHELVLSQDGSTLVVANGGILTHPETGREKLNLDTMQPSIAYLDARTGALLEQAMIPAKWHQLSSRHLAISADGTVVFGCQYQGPIEDDLPLVGMHRRGEAIHWLKAPSAVNRNLHNYCGSVRIDASGTLAAISAPRGDMITFWDLHKQVYISYLRSRDGCGLAATHQAGEFLVSTGRGRVLKVNPLKQTREVLHLHQPDRVSWDNHMALLS